MSLALELRDVTVKQDGQSSLRDVSLNVKRGEFLAVLGPNGAGKTTLLRLLIGLVKAEGRVGVLDSDVGRLNWRDLGRLRRRIGYMPQIGATAPVVPLSVGEVVEIGRAGRVGTGRRLAPTDREVCRKWIDHLGLRDLAERPFNRLSGGEQRKVHLARVLAQEPELMLLDEPAGHLDFRWQETMTQLIAGLWRETGMTILMVTHDLRHLPPNVSAVALLSSGRLLNLGRPHDVLTSESLSRTYGQSLEVMEKRGRFFAIPAGGA